MGLLAGTYLRKEKGLTTMFKMLLSDKGYLPFQLFNCENNGLFWKKMPKHTYITAEEKKLSGHKPKKHRPTLAFCANASGDFKVKPLLVYLCFLLILLNFIIDQNVILPLCMLLLVY